MHETGRDETNYYAHTHFRTISINMPPQMVCVATASATSSSPLSSLSLSRHHRLERCAECTSQQKHVHASNIPNAAAQDLILFKQSLKLHSSVSCRRRRQRSNARVDCMRDGVRDTQKPQRLTYINLPHIKMFHAFKDHVVHAHKHTSSCMSYTTPPLCSSC